MALLGDDVYQETKEIVLGSRKKSPLLAGLSDWFRSEHSVKALNIHFSQLEGPENRFRLCVIIENTEDYQKMYTGPFQPDEEYQAQIALEFRELARNHRLTDEANLENLLVTYNDFSDEARVRANWKAEEAVKIQIKSRYPVVWEVIAIFSRAVVFYYADADIAANEYSGVSQAITDIYYSILKGYDELNYFTRENINLKFDSKENLDRNYRGNLFYYTR